MMEISYSKRIAFFTLMFLSFASGIIFLCVNHLDFISASIRYNLLHLPNIAYIFMQIVGYIFIPLGFLLPSIFPYGRIRFAKWSFIVFGVCVLLTLSWIIYFLSSQPPMDIFDSAKVNAFLSKRKYIFFLTYWDTYGLSASLFTLILGCLCIYIGLSFDKSKDVVRNLLAVLVGVRVFIPLINNLFVNGRIFSLYWITNNFLTLASVGLFLLAIMVAGTNDYTWVEFVWDQTVLTDEQEQFEIFDEFSEE